MTFRGLFYALVFEALAVLAGFVLLLAAAGALSGCGPSAPEYDASEVGVHIELIGVPDYVVENDLRIVFCGEVGQEPCDPECIAPAGEVER